jgi:hypothetical protein
MAMPMLDRFTTLGADIFAMVLTLLVITRLVKSGPKVFPPDHSGREVFLSLPFDVELQLVVYFTIGFWRDEKIEGASTIL